MNARLTPLIYEFQKIYSINHKMFVFVKRLFTQNSHSEGLFFWNFTVTEKKFSRSLFLGLNDVSNRRKYRKYKCTVRVCVGWMQIPGGSGSIPTLISSWWVSISSCFGHNCGKIINALIRINCTILVSLKRIALVSFVEYIVFLSLRLVLVNNCNCPNNFRLFCLILAIIIQ